MSGKSLAILPLPLLLVVFFFDIVFLGKTLSTAALLPGDYCGHKGVKTSGTQYL